MTQQIEIVRAGGDCIGQPRYKLDPPHPGSVDDVVLIGEDRRSTFTGFSHMSVNIMLCVFMVVLGRGRTMF